MRRLTDVAFWDESWWKGQRPRRLRLYRDFDFETVRLLRSAGGPAPRRVLEIGAGGSRILPYLRRKFGYEVLGSDFSLLGCGLLRANLALEGVGGAVVCEDLFQSSLPAGMFDLVYSSGLLEHFDDLRGVIAEHLRVLKPGGRLVLIAPNLQGIQGRIMRRLAPPLWNVHRIFGPADLASLFKTLGLDHIHSGYLGSFFIHIGCDPGWPVVRGWPGWLRGSAYWSIRVTSGLLSLFFRLAPVRPHSRVLSTAFFVSGTKIRQARACSASAEGSDSADPPKPVSGELRMSGPGVD